jgi:hypothetical protein
MKPIDLHALETVTGGTTLTSRCAGGSSDLLNQLTGLANTIKDIGSAAKSTGFSNTDMLMLGLLLSQQNRAQVNVFVRRPYWW